MPAFDPNEGETARLVRMGREMETIKERIERETKEKLDSMKNAKPNPIESTKMIGCHWCDGVMHVTPTKGRLECQTCGAVSLCGRQESITHVGTGR